VPYLPDAPWLHVELDRAGSPPRRSARVRHRVLLVGLMLADAAGLGVGWSVSVLSPDPRWRAAEPGGLAVTALLAAVPVWWAAIAGAGGYPARYRAPGTPGHGRFADGAVRFAATAMVVTALALPDSARGVALALPAALLTALVLRLSWVRLGDLAVGAGGRRVLVVGSAVAAASVVCRLSDNRSQLQVVGRCAWERIGGEEGAPAVDGYGVEGADVIRRRVTAAARAARADLVLVADAAALPADGIRRLAWSLEGTGLGLLVATGLSDVATSRLRVHLAAGLPLLAVDEPALTGAPRVIKEVVDRVGAAVLLVLLAPLMLLVAAAVRLADPGPAVFRQERVGRHGQRFTMYTFRSMRVNAEGWRPALETLNDDRSRGGGATLFTMRGDPRVTTLGRLLRRSSLDELPQLLNVLRGEMSLVGPRPPLLAEVERYQTQALRRLRVKPGLTGLWQVSGRADLDCDESLRLDLSYVENWSVGMDLRILARTPLAVMGGRGAR
jgi:exopolysaccharide biosynthesis polyprenyl glycosylphosphotransferase